MSSSGPWASEHVVSFQSPRFCGVPSSSPSWNTATIAFTPCARSRAAARFTASASSSKRRPAMADWVTSSGVDFVTAPMNPTAMPPNRRIT